jgi:hypothetical protein
MPGKLKPLDVKRDRDGAGHLKHLVVPRMFLGMPDWIVGAKYHAEYPNPRARPRFYVVPFGTLGATTQGSTMPTNAGDD